MAGRAARTQLFWLAGSMEEITLIMRSLFTTALTLSTREAAGPEEKIYAVTNTRAKNMSQHCSCTVVFTGLFMN